MLERLRKYILPVSVALVAIVALGVGYGIGNRGVPFAANGGALQAVNGQPGGEVEVIDGSADSIAIPGFETLSMKARKTTQEVELYNPQRNRCYFEISICLSEGTELFHSGLLAPGKTLETIELKNALEPGTYQGALIRYSCFALKDLQPLNGADITFTLEVLP